MENKHTEIRGKAPLRISFAGGGTDINEVFEKYGGAVINATIDKFTHAILNLRNDDNIFIEGNTLAETDEFTQKIINKLNPNTGFNLWTYNEVPPGRGLGSSSTYSALLTKMISELEGKFYDDHKLVETIYGIESDAGKCGWQDQYATVIGGFNFMEFSKNNKVIYPLRIKYRAICDLEEHLLAIYTKKEHESKLIQRLNLQNIDATNTCKLKDLAYEMRDCLLGNQIDRIGDILHRSWLAKRNSNITTPDIDKIYEFGMNNGAFGGKLLGAGLGGYMLFFINPRDKTGIKNAFKNIGYDNMDFHFTEKGVETWSR